MPDGELVLIDPIENEPRALYGVGPEGDPFWNIVAGLPRYRLHNCPGK